MVLKRVLMSVDLPNPDSPENMKRKRGKLDVKPLQLDKGPTNDHGGELEALPDALPMNLVRKVGESDVTHQFFADNIRNWCAGTQRRCRTVSVAVGGRDIAIAGGSIGVGHLKDKDVLGWRKAKRRVSLLSALSPGECWLASNWKLRLLCFRHCWPLFVWVAQCLSCFFLIFLA